MKIMKIRNVIYLILFLFSIGTLVESQTLIPSPLVPPELRYEIQTKFPTVKSMEWYWIDSLNNYCVLMDKKYKYYLLKENFEVPKHILECMNARYPTLKILSIKRDFNSDREILYKFIYREKQIVVNANCIEVK